MADSETVDSTQQVTSKTPVTKIKNRKRVEAGKKIAERTRQAREAQKKALVEAQAIIANQPLQKKADPPASDLPAAEPPAASDPQTKNVLTTTQWLSVISIIISVVDIYYTREEIKKGFCAKKKPADFMPPPVKTQRKVGLQSID